VTRQTRTAARLTKPARSARWSPAASSALNANTARLTISNAGIISVIGGQFGLFTQSGGHLLADISGYYTA
jgi:hypothetical protein